MMISNNVAKVGELSETEFRDTEFTGAYLIKNKQMNKQKNNLVEATPTLSLSLNTDLAKGIWYINK